MSVPRRDAPRSMGAPMILTFTRKKGRVPCYRGVDQRLIYPAALRAPMGDTRASWEALADRWDRARRRAWPPVAAFCESFPAGARILDLAAGNGRHGALAVKNGARVIGADFSRSLVSFARERGLDATQADARALPFADATFDGAIFAAGLHCIPRRASRLGALAELRRVLKPGARALVTVWTRFRDGSLADALTADAEVAWGEVERYYHFYGPVELMTDVRSAGFADARLSGERLASGARWLPDNWFVTVRA